jgi:hypothetical protein
METSDAQFEVVGFAKDARYLTDNLDKPVRPFFFLPEAQAEYSGPKQGSLFLSGVIIEWPYHSDKAGSQSAHSADPAVDRIDGSQYARDFDSHAERAGYWSVHPAAAHCTPHFVVRNPFAHPGFDWAVWS